ncbi:hypothetical protein ACHAW6_008686 [Cyclotella cf. meneghiniana]
MESILPGINYADVYIDNAGSFPKIGTSMCNSLQTSYIISVRMIHNQPVEMWMGCQRNQLNWLALEKKIEAILHMDCPCNATELCMFIGYINYYRDMWPSYAHIFKPLTDNSGLKKHAPIPWTNEMQHAFDKICALCKKAGRWSNSLASCQNCSRTIPQWRKRCSIVATLEECHGMLLGADIHAFPTIKT